MTTGLLVLMGRWEEFMARSKGGGDTVTFFDSCMKFVSVFRKPHLPSLFITVELREKLI